MKAIIIRGEQSAGKSTTIREVCKRLNPQSIYKLYNKEKDILIFAGSPTEIDTKISIAIDACIEIGIDISFAIVSRRYAERKVGFDTRKELKEKGFEIIHEELIHKIEQDNFEQTEEWNKRVDNIVNLVKQNL